MPTSLQKETLVAYENTNVMAVNKNAVIRYMYLDQMLSDSYHYYTRSELTEKCNEKLLADGFGEVSKRTVELDIQSLQDAPFSMDIVEETINGRRIVRYADRAQSLFSKPMTSEEKRLLTEVLNTLGQFSGLDNFTWLDDLQAKLNDRKSFGRGQYNMDEMDNRKIISFSSNEYLKNKELLGWFFSAIANRKVVSLVYRKFNSAGPVHFVVYPYHLKQYNDRWYLICNHNGTDEYPYSPDFLMTLPLDRIESYEEVSGADYIDCPIDITDRYQDVVGISYHADRKPEKVMFAISETKEPYISTKPLHGSQLRFSEAEQKRLHIEYPELEGYSFYQLECIPNNELKEMFYSFDKDIVVLHRDIQDEIYAEMLRQVELYQKLRNGMARCQNILPF